MRSAELEGLFRIERGVNPAEHDPGAALAHDPPDFISTQGVAGVDADADHVTGLNGQGIENLERFVRDQRVPVGARRCRREHVQPARRDNPNAEREMARINQMDAQKAFSSTAGCVKSALPGELALGRTESVCPRYVEGRQNASALSMACPASPFQGRIPETLDQNFMPPTRRPAVHFCTGPALPTRTAGLAPPLTGAAYDHVRGLS
jgi:hypothetical protein